MRNSVRNPLDLSMGRFKIDATVFDNVGAFLNTATTATDVYELLLYYSCFAAGGTGAFLSEEGTAEYFDIAIGTFRKKRLGREGGGHIWEYKIPGEGELVFSAETWLYKSASTGWLIGIRSNNKPDIKIIESLMLIASGAIGFVHENEKRIEGRDNMTGLRDRGRFFRDVEHLSEVFDRNGKPLHLFFIDLNNFKAINDTLGHDMGDRVLQSQAFNIVRTVADAGMVYRYGGDEFCVLLPGASKENVIKLMRRIEISSAQAPGGIPISASVGIACYQVGESVEQFVDRADKEMYSVKIATKKVREGGLSIVQLSA